MNRFLTGSVVVAAVGFSGYFCVAWFIKPAPAAAAPRSAEITYICRETGQIMRGPRERPPDAGAAGPCKMLVQALYCPQCQAWYPAPPPEMAERTPLGPVCPEHRTGLFEDIPGSAVPEQK